MLKNCFKIETLNHNRFVYLAGPGVSNDKDSTPPPIVVEDGKTTDVKPKETEPPKDEKPDDATLINMSFNETKNQGTKFALSANKSLDNMMKLNNQQAQA